MTPKRIQLKRTKGWRMPSNTIKVDRTTRWGNPFATRYGWTSRESVDAFRLWMSGVLNGGEYVVAPDGTHIDITTPPDIAPLRGKNLACWCKPGNSCHANVLLELANAHENPMTYPNESNLYAIANGELVIGETIPEADAAEACGWAHATIKQMRFDAECNSTIRTGQARQIRVLRALLGLPHAPDMNLPSQLPDLPCNIEEMVGSYLKDKP